MPRRNESGFHRRSNDEKQVDYIYCNHCDTDVSRSTYERHQRKREMRSHLRTCLPKDRPAPSSDESSSSADERIGKLYFQVFNGYVYVRQ